MIVGALAASLSLTGCATFFAGVVGIERNGDELTARVLMCNDYQSDRLDLTPRNGQWFIVPHPTWDFPKSGEATIDLGAVDEFTALLEDGDNDLRSTATTGLGGVVRFSAQDIADLADGEILSSTDDSRVTELRPDVASFEQAAQDYCDTHQDDFY